MDTKFHFIIYHRVSFLVTTDLPYVTNPLSVSVNSCGKRRIILDLREVNKHILKQSVKYDCIRTALLYVEKKKWCFKFDITSAYHHIDIFPHHGKHLGFSWEFNGHTRYFQFNALPSGLTSAPYIFTKLTRPLIKKNGAAKVRRFLCT
jgi:hypothetical protein